NHGRRPHRSGAMRYLIQEHNGNQNMTIKTHTIGPGQRGWDCCQKAAPVSLGSEASKIGSTAGARGASVSAFTLMETMVAVLVAGILLPTLYAGFAAGFSLVQMTRENLRATQIMVQRMEAVRLASY